MRYFHAHHKYKYFLDIIKNKPKSILTIFFYEMEVNLNFKYDMLFVNICDSEFIFSGIKKQKQLEIAGCFF